MACTKPLSGYRAPDGTLRFAGESHTVLLTRKQEITVACGQCLDCRLERSRQWAVRITHEAKTHEHNSFITLTYNEANLPEDKSLNVRDWQLFAKRLRKLHPFRYYHCGEYGDDTGRPHYHAAMFGVDFSYDRTPYKLTPNGDQLYRSETLEDLWELGDCYIGELNFESAAYVARYIMKKQTGKNSVSAYESAECDSVTGEVIDLAPPLRHHVPQPRNRQTLARQVHVRCLSPGRGLHQWRPHKTSGLLRQAVRQGAPRSFRKTQTQTA